MLNNTSCDKSVNNCTPKPLRLPLQKHPLSPKALSPLIIPTSSAPSLWLARRDSKDDETLGPDVQRESGRILDFSTSIKCSARKQSQALMRVPRVVMTSTVSTKLLPKQRNDAPSDRTFPHPERPALNSAFSAKDHPQTSDIRYIFNQRPIALGGPNPAIHRDRTKENFDASPSKRLPSATITKSIHEKRSAFEALRPSSTPAVASESMSADEIETLRSQAIWQATRFGVFRSKDVGMLSLVSCLIFLSR